MMPHGSVYNKNAPKYALRKGTPSKGATVPMYPSAGRTTTIAPVCLSMPYFAYPPPPDRPPCTSSSSRRTLQRAIRTRDQRCERRLRGDKLENNLLRVRVRSEELGKVWRTGDERPHKGEDQDRDCSPVLSPDQSLQSRQGFQHRIDHKVAPKIRISDSSTADTSGVGRCIRARVDHPHQYFGKRLNTT